MTIGKLIEELTKLLGEHGAYAPVMLHNGYGLPVELLGVYVDNSGDIIIEGNGVGV